MTTLSSKLNGLAERVEAAAGPSRELELEIWRTLNPIHAKIADDMGKVPLEWLHAYTSSLDAAMSLAEGAGKSVPQLLAEAMERISCLPVLISQMSASEYAQTLARFFTAACLRAAASKARADGGEG